PGKDIRYKPSAITLTFDMAKAILENEKMGEGKETDMLCVSISSTDLIGHTYGTRGKENHAAYIQLDNDLADFFTLLDQRYGRYGYLLFLSADHGAVHNPNFLEHNKIPTGSFSTSETAKALNTAMKKHFNISEALISQVTTCQLYLNNDAIQRSNLKRHDVVQFIKQEVIKNKHVAYVVDQQHAATEPIPALLRERAINGYNNKRSGDILIIPQANVYPTNYKSDFKGTTHGLWNPYDAHIPLIFMGWNVQHGATARITNITDIAATVCAMLHIQMPDACIGEPIKEIVK
ncbi:MAG: alkaline phosphatase family protein, partial [Prevotella sp.]|nr:alkaline phosphatase family protein [Prevotella sp.]